MITGWGYDVGVVFTPSGVADTKTCGQARITAVYMWTGTDLGRRVTIPVLALFKRLPTFFDEHI